VTQPVPPNNPFGQPAQPQAQNAPSLFGQPATAQPANNPFGQPSTTSPFGQPAPAAAKPFGQPQQAPATQPFGGPATTAAAPPALNAFAQPAPTTTTSTAPAAAPAAASARQAANPYGPGATRQHPDPSTYSTRDADGRLRTFKGRPVTYETPRNGGKPVPVLRNFDGSAVRIWMPNGPPPYTADSEAEPAQYEDEAVKEQWRYFVETGRFKDGVMPEVPPKREFCLWDF
jgi:nucleoporin NUP42